MEPRKSRLIALRHPVWSPAALRTVPALLCSLLLPTNLPAQTAQPEVFRARDGLIMSGAALMWVSALALNWHDGPPSCAPCDPASLPFFDRWAIHEPETVTDYASHFALAGVALVGWADRAGQGRKGRTTIVASIESFLWAEAITHLTQTAIGRKRPVLYTDRATEVADVRHNQRSMPSGHTAGAFALATSYWLSQGNLTNDDKPWLRWVLMAGAASVGVLRIAAGMHHPSDVLIGAGVGVGSAVIIHMIKF